LVDVFSFPQDCFLPKWSTGFLSSNGASVNTKSNGHKERIVRVDSTILALNLIDSAKMQEQMKPQLLRFLEELDATRLFGKTLFELTTRAPNYDWLAIAVDAPTEFNQLLLRQLNYGQAATVLGQDNAAIFARFATRQKPDWDFELAECAKKIRAEDSDGLTRLRAYHNSNKDLKISELLEATLIEKGSAEYLQSGAGRLHLDLLNHVTGSQFPASVVMIAKGLERHARLVLFRRLLDFRWNDTTAMEPLLKWCDDQLRDQKAIMSNPDSAAIIQMFLWLVFNQSNTISTDCKQLIADRLESYSGLSAEDFWFESSEQNPPFMRLANLREQMLRKAVLVLAAKGEYSDKIRCHAWITILHSYEDTKRLSPALLDVLLKAAELKIEQVANDRSESSVLTKVDEAFGHFAKTILLAQQEKGDQYSLSIASFFSSLALDHGVSELGLVCGYLQKLQAENTSELTAKCLTSIRELHKHAESAGNDIESCAMWDSIYRQHSRRGHYAANVEQLPAVVNHMTYLQTGLLLGKDFNEMAERPVKLYNEYVERQARFIQPGDTLSIFVSGLASGEPPVIQAGTRTPIAGFPVIVSQENTIFIPNLGTFDTKDKDLEQLKKEIVEKAQPLQKLNAQQHVGQVNVAFLLRHNQQLELRNVTGTPAAK
jgi:hypothetical protein